MASWSGLAKPVRHALRWDATSGALGGLFSGALFPFLGVIARRDLHASAYLIALLSASGAVGNLFNPVIAHHIRNRAKLPHAVWPALAGRACFLLMPLAVVAPAYVAICFLANAVAALASPAYAAVIRDAYPMDRRGQLMGWVRVVAVAGSMIGALAGGFALARVSFRWAFPMAAAVGLLASMAFSRIGVPAAPEGPASPRPGMLESYKLVRADRTFGLYSTCFYLYGFGNLIMGPVVPVFQVDVLKISPQWVGYLAMVASASSMLGYLYWGRVLDRHGPFRLMLMVISVISLMPVTYFFARGVPVLLIAAAASGFAMSGGDLGYVNAAMCFGPRHAAAAYAGMFAFLQACRGIPGPFVGAALSNLVGPRPVFLVALGLWAVAVTVLVTRGGLRIRPQQDG
jgi:MFS family permease